MLKIALAVGVLTQCANAGLLTLRWQPVDEASGYRVEWRPVGGEHWISQAAAQNEALVDSENPIEFRVFSVNKYQVESLPSDIFTMGSEEPEPWPEPKPPPEYFRIIQITASNGRVYGLTDDNRVMIYNQIDKRWME